MKKGDFLKELKRRDDSQARVIVEKIYLYFTQTGNTQVFLDDMGFDISNGLEQRLFEDENLKNMVRELLMEDDWELRVKSVYNCSSQDRHNAKGVKRLLVR